MGFPSTAQEKGGQGAAPCLFQPPALVSDNGFHGGRLFGAEVSESRFPYAPPVKGQSLDGFPVLFVVTLLSGFRQRVSNSGKDRLAVLPESPVVCPVVALAERYVIGRVLRP
jgi:hypothetical protein